MQGEPQEPGGADGEKRQVQCGIKSISGNEDDGVQSGGGARRCCAV